MSDAECFCGKHFLTRCQRLQQELKILQQMVFLWQFDYLKTTAILGI